MLTRDQILAAKDCPVHEVDMSDYWEGSIYVRALSGATRVALAKLADAEDDQLAACVVLFASDAEGNSLFTEEDIEALSRKNYEALERIVGEGLKFNKLGAGEVEQEKND